MNNKINEFLEQFTLKFNITSDKIWNILLKQALINGITNIIIIISIISFGYFGTHFVLKKTIRPTKTYLMPYPKAEWDEIAPLIILGWSLIVVVLILCLYCFSENCINALINPEYWAFNNLLSNFKNK